jgi:hypothetical protein
MQKQTLCYLVIGTSLAVLLQRLAQRRYVPRAFPAQQRGTSAEIIDLDNWKQSRGLMAAAASAK